MNRTARASPVSSNYAQAKREQRLGRRRLCCHRGVCLDWASWNPSLRFGLAVPKLVLKEGPSEPQPRSRSTTDRCKSKALLRHDSEGLP
mmetsp:Transcript_71992/g.156895  ORF Transcript_71992/g.156895 Transcript_71992/m.156895 type:complete len:89 (+) Transcript_71992:634-900(+)